ncbi:hypothetical protein CDAR_504081 [Caerostris darwini]|uniref:Uncharacterized protein n=1 Tax=Caerostris darwini TaxID=1538125 RepID=A0AAV4UR59_9ARAC|nr:hypothetical protein CDAR_504081 [Caerostris darwini]
MYAACWPRTWLQLTQFQRERLPRELDRVRELHFDLAHDHKMTLHKSTPKKTSGCTKGPFALSGSAGMVMNFVICVLHCFREKKKGVVKW